MGTDGRRLLIAALVLRVGWALAARQWWGYREDSLYDDGVFLGMARGFLGRGTVLATHPPVYPLFLAPFLVLGDWGVSLARWVQMLLSAAVAPLVYRLALELRLSRAAALVAGVLIVLHPMMIYFSVRMMSETLYVVLVVGFFLAWLSAWRSGSLGTAVAAGILGGVAALTRGVMLPFGGVLALAAFCRRREQPRWALLVAVCGLSWAGTMAPWAARNWAVYHRFIPVSVQGGWNFYEGLTLDPDELRRRPVDMGEEARSKGLGDVFALNEYFGAKAKAWVLADPLRFLKLCFGKAVRFWRAAPLPPHGTASRLAAGLFAGVLLAAALLGLRALARASGSGFLLAWVLYVNLLHAVFASNLRYRLPVEPVLALSAGVAVAAFLARSF